MSKKKEEEKENRLKVVHIVIARCRLLSYILQSFISCRNAFNIKLFLQTQTILSLEHHWKKFEISNLKYGRHFLASKQCQIFETGDEDVGSNNFFGTAKTTTLLRRT